ncbi:Cullin binding-domain-containing protein [Haematococcus lacustris]
MLATFQHSPPLPCGQEITAAMAGTSIAPVAAPVLQYLAGAFTQFSELVDNGPEASGDALRQHLQATGAHCQAHGISGTQAVEFVGRHRTSIAWETMTPDMFAKFYRFMFHLCKQPSRKHIETSVAISAWRLLLPGRFRLLPEWLEFMSDRQGSTSGRALSEDQWRQVYDFTRAVHEDLSNFDTNGAWACILDEFVEHLRRQRRDRSHAMDEEGLVSSSSGGLLQDAGLSLGVSCLLPPMSPRLGSKRRSPDVDTVADQLSAIPLPSTAGPEEPSCGPPGSATKRLRPASRLGSHSAPAGLAACHQPLPSMHLLSPASPLDPHINQLLTLPGDTHSVASPQHTLGQAAQLRLLAHHNHQQQQQQQQQGQQQALLMVPELPQQLAAEACGTSPSLHSPHHLHHLLPPQHNQHLEPCDELAHSTLLIPDMQGFAIDLPVSSARAIAQKQQPPMPAVTMAA